MEEPRNGNRRMNMWTCNMTMYYKPQNPGVMLETGFGQEFDNMVLEIWSDPEITAQTGYEYTRSIQFQCLGSERDGITFTGINFLSRVPIVEPSMIQEMFVRARALGLEPYGSNDWHPVFGKEGSGDEGMLAKDMHIVEHAGCRYPQSTDQSWMGDRPEWPFPVSDDLDPPLRSGLAPPRPPPSVILSSLFDQGVRSKFHGEIKSFSIAKGYGFISVEKVWNLLRCDVHFSLSEVYDVDPQQIAEKVRVGSKCTFWCNLDRSGRPQAKVVRITEVAERPPENKTLTETDQVKYEGKIKSFKEDTGYGFISCDETFKQFNRDVFLHHKQLASCKAKVGDWVRFKIFESKGQPKALGLELIEAADAPQSPQAASDKAADAPHSPQTASDKAASTQDTASARLLDDEQVAKPEELEDPADLWERGWTRYRISESSDEYWLRRRSRKIRKWNRIRSKGQSYWVQDYGRWMPRGATRQYNHGTGDCLFYAVQQALQVLEPTKNRTARQVRAFTTAFMERHKAEYAALWDGRAPGSNSPDDEQPWDGSFDDYLAGIRLSGCWATYLECFALAAGLQRDIFMLTEKGDVWHIMNILQVQLRKSSAIGQSAMKGPPLPRQQIIEAFKLRISKVQDSEAQQHPFV
eukprot:s1118_g17.t1